MSEKQKKSKQTSLTSKHKKLRRTLKIISISFLSLIALIGIVIGILMYVIFTPERLTPIVNKQVAKYLDVDFSTESIDLTFFKTFPDFSIRIKNGDIISKVFSEGGMSYQKRDSLLSFSTCYLSFNPMQFLKQDELIVHKVILENCNAYAFMDTTGRANWEVYASDNTTEDDTSSFDLFEFFSQISLEQLSITSGLLIFDDTRDTLYANLNDTKIDISGHLEKEKGNLKLDFSTKKIAAQQSDLRANIDGFLLSVSGKMNDEKIDVSLDFSSDNISITQPELAAELKNAKLALSGQMDGDEISGDLDFSIKNIFTQQGEVVYSRKIHLDLGSGFNADIKKGYYRINDAKLAINGLDFSADGYARTANFDTIDMDVNVKLHAPAIAAVKKLIPLELLPILNQYQVDGDILLNANAKGTYAPNQLPAITASILLQDGAVSSGNLPVAFNDITIDADAFVDFKNTGKSYANINKLEAYWPYSYLKVKGEAGQILNDPKVSAKVELASNLSEIKKYASFSEEMDMNGEIDIDLKADFVLSDAMNARLQKIYVSGNILADKLLYSSPSDSLFVRADTLNIQLVTNTPDEAFASGKKLGKIDLFGQAISFIQSDQIDVTMTKLKGKINVGAPKNNEITDARVDILLNNLAFKMGDSLQLNSDNINLKGNIQPEKINNVTEASLYVNLGKTDVELIPNKVEVEKMELQLDLSPLTESGAKYFSFSLADNNQQQVIIEKDTLKIATLDTVSKQETDYMKMLDKLLDEFDFNLLLDIKDVRVLTDLIPLETQVPSFNIMLNKDVLTFLDTRVKVGNSNIDLSGYINNIQSVVFDKGVVKGNVNLSSDLIDCNELLAAFVFTEEGSAPETPEDTKEALQQALDTIPLLIVIPENISVGINTNIKQLLYDKANFQNVTGQIVVRNQHVLLDDLKLISDIGEIKILMLYEATSTKKALAGVDLFMDKVDIKKLIEVIPMVDTMLPMLKAFEGILDCQIVARTEFDPMMNINLDATTASCYLHGENLVLLDGETFRTISKWLLFKNKKRNIIDSLSVEFFMKEKKIVFFPFSIRLDRYRAMVGGLQNADLSFDYHISVVNSPLPFKIGLNIKGNPDKFKIRPTLNVKYRKLAKNSDNINSLNYSNQRKQTYAAILKSINDIIYAPEKDDVLIGPSGADDFLLDIDDTSTENTE